MPTYYLSIHDLRRVCIAYDNAEREQYCDDEENNTEEMFGDREEERIRDDNTDTSRRETEVDTRGADKKIS